MSKKIRIVQKVFLAPGINIQDVVKAVKEELVLLGKRA